MVVFEHLGKNISHFVRRERESQLLFECQQLALKREETEDKAIINLLAQSIPIPPAPPKKFLSQTNVLTCPRVAAPTVRLCAETPVGRANYYVSGGAALSDEVTRCRLNTSG